MAAESQFNSEAERFLSFVNASPTPFHVVLSTKKLLEDSGFTELKEKDPWSSICKPAGKYYLTRNGSSIIAFAIGGNWKPGNPISIVGAHTDSPCLRIKPVSRKSSEGYVQIGVETYGGGIWHSWFDRDLGLAGRAMIRGEDGSIKATLVRIDRPILRIPTLAIHLDRQESFSFNKETQLFPIAGLVAAELDRIGAADSNEANNRRSNEETSNFSPLKATTERHHPYLVEVLASELSVKPEAIIDFELSLYDTQKSTFGGLLNEFIFSARLDNLNSSYCATVGLIKSLSNGDEFAADSTIRLVSLFDHEEIGSNTAQGADSNFLPSIIRRLSVLPPLVTETAHSDKSCVMTNTDESVFSTVYEQSLATSFLLSADMAHAVHPNYAYKYEPDHRPQLNKGPVIKINANARYATNSPGISLLQEVARLANIKTYSHGTQTGVPLQLFVVRNDSSCGSTIGPMLSAVLGMRTLDLGNPQLSMHSIRETGGTKDIGYSVALFESFFRRYGELQGKIFVD